MIQTWDDLVTRVREEACISVNITDLKTLCGCADARRFTTKKMRERLNKDEVAIGSSLEDLPSHASAANPTRDVLLYDARQNGAMAKLFAAVDAVRAGRVPHEEAYWHAIRLKEVARQYRG